MCSFAVARLGALSGLQSSAASISTRSDSGLLVDGLSAHGLDLALQLDDLV